ncbi:DUF5808 domain-containing protein [Mesobacillus foraminis]|uniref:DUF1648 domain-containing protein n=1 Tax=Mesobacillus foraminis TaxID=279826 RepID=UPI0039A2103F
MALTILLITLAFLAMTQTAIPYLVKQTVVFGVSIPEGEAKDDRLAAYKKTYSLLVFSLSAVAMVAFLIWALSGNPAEGQLVLTGTAIQFGIIFFSMALYFYFHGKTAKRKRTEKWGEDLKQVKITDMSARSKDEMLPWYVYLLPIAVTLGVMGYTATQYGALPEQIPTHWGANGKPDAFTAKSPLSVITPLIVLFCMQGMFLGINEATKRSGIKISASRPQASTIRQLTLRKYSSWFMFLVCVLMTMLFAFLQLTTIHEGLADDAVMMILPVVFMLVVLIGSIVFAVKVGTAGQQAGEGPAAQGIRDYDEDDHWKGGLFYFNKNDPSIFVEKRFGVGWTINFANPKGYFLIFGPLLLILLVSYFS